MRRIDAAGLLLLALSLASLSYRLGAVPALTGDEAWIGIFVQRLRSYGAVTPHQMNTYTGPLFAWCVSAVSSFFAPGVGGLRAFGAAMNALAFAAYWLHLRRRVSAEAAASWGLLLAGSAFLLLKSRLAWEVYALQPLLIAGILSALARPGSTVALALLCVAGTQNHFIFLSVPASLVVLFGVRAAWDGDEAAFPNLRSSTAALAASVAFAVLKSRITDASWTAHRPDWAAALVLAPLLAGVAAAYAPDALRIEPWRRLRRPLEVAFALTMLAFGVWHLVPMVQLLAGPVVYARVFSLPLPLWARLPLLAWGSFLAALVVWNSAGARTRPGLAPHERTLLLWPAAFACVFIAFRHTSSLRYYSIPACVWLAALSAALPRMARRDQSKLVPVALAAALVAQGLVWRELASPADRAPLKFKVGWRRESSWDFARKDALFAAFDASRACRIGHMERSFVAIPLQFHSLERTGGCEADRVFDADQCPECPSAPYYRWAVGPAK